MKIGNNIRKIRQLRGLSQENLSYTLEMSQRNYSRIENDQIDIKLSCLTKIAKSLDVTIEEIFRFDEKVIFENQSFSKKSIIKAENKKELKELKERIERIERIERSLN